MFTRGDGNGKELSPDSHHQKAVDKGDDEGANNRSRGVEDRRQSPLLQRPDGAQEIHRDQQQPHCRRYSRCRDKNRRGERREGRGCGVTPHSKAKKESGHTGEESLSSITSYKSQIRWSPRVRLCWRQMLNINTIISNNAAVEQNFWKEESFRKGCLSSLANKVGSRCIRAIWSNVRWYRPHIRLYSACDSSFTSD